MSLRELLERKADLRSPQKPVNALLIAIREKLEINQGGLAFLLGVSSRSVYRWETRMGRPEAFMEKKIKNLHLLVEELLRVSSPKSVMVWLQAPLLNFYEETPLDICDSNYATRFLISSLRDKDGAVNTIRREMEMRDAASDGAPVS